MTASKLDISMPIEVSSYDVESFNVHGGSRSGQGDVPGAMDESHNYCQDCIELKTEKFQENVNLLRTQTRLLTTGAMISGILGIAVLSG